MSRLPATVRRLPARVRVAAAIEALEPEARRVLTLRLVEGLSALETAGALRLPARRVERLLIEALERIVAETASRPRRAQRRAA